MALSLGLAGVLNSVTASRTGNASLTKIERVELIPLKSLKSHPDNFYKLSDIEALAKLILINKEIDTLTVKHNQETNDYTVISGHRRMAAVSWLVEHGKITEEEAKLPCKIVSKPSIDFFTEEEAEQFKIIAGNIGQRKYTTVDTIQEIVKTEPLARKIFDNLPEEERKSFLDFREYFARTFFGKSSAWLQRLKSLSHLTDQAMEMVDNGEINVTAAAVLATMEPEQQAKFIAKMLNGEINSTVSAIQNFKKYGMEAATTDKEHPGEPVDTLENNTDTEEVEASINESVSGTVEVDTEDTDEEPEEEETFITEAVDDNTARFTDEDEDLEVIAESRVSAPQIERTSVTANQPKHNTQVVQKLALIYSSLIEMKLSPNGECDYEPILNDLKYIIELLKNE